jgi:group I intron endonuclease
MAQVSGIYIVLNTKNGKVYLGQAQDLRKRWQNHRSALRRGHHCNHHLQNAWNKYGAKAFQFKVLEYCPIEQLNEREQHHITIYRARGMAYNLTDGGDGGRNPSVETRQRISESLKGKTRSIETRAKISESLKGRKCAPRPPCSEETRKKLSEAGKRRSNSAKTRQKISESNKGKSFSIETRHKISEGLNRFYAMKRGETIEE